MRSRPRRAVVRVLAGVSACLAVAGLGVASTAVADEAKGTAMVLVLDASGSMNEPDGHGSTKIKSAKTAIKTIIGQLPADAQVGLRVYGHRVPSKPDHAKACQDTELIAPVAPVDRAALTAAVDSFKALGETPIGVSLQKAAADLPPGVNGAVVLVSDGEDSCAPPQPCDVAKQLKASGVHLTVDTIGLKVGATAKKQLTCISETTGGTYSDVSDTATLGTVLGRVTTQARSRKLATLAGTPIDGTPAPEQAPMLTAGSFSDTLVKKETLYYGLPVTPEQVAKVRITVDSQQLADNSSSCCVSAKWVTLDGDSLGSDNAAIYPPKLVRFAAQTQPVQEAGTIYLELSNDSLYNSLTFAFQVEVTGPGAAGATASASSGADASATATEPVVASPSDPTPAASQPTIAAQPAASTGYSGRTVLAAGGGGLVLGLAVGAIATLLLTRIARRPRGVPRGVEPQAYPVAGAGPAAPPRPYGDPPPSAGPPQGAGSPPYGGLPPGVQPYGGQPNAAPPYGDPPYRGH